MKLKFCPTTIFRETPKVTFFDAGIGFTNGCDVVIHSGEAISPPNEFKYRDYFLDDLNWLSWSKVESNLE